MKNITLFLLIVFLSFSSCKENEGVYSPDRIISYLEEEVNDTIAGRLFKGIPIANVEGIEIVDSFLIVIQDNTNSIFSIYNLDTDSVIAQIGSIGHSKSELGFIPMSYYFMRERNKVLMCIQDIYTPVTHIYDLCESVRQNKLVHHKTIKHKISQASDNIIYYIGGEKNILCQGPYSEDIRDGYSKPPYIAMFKGADETDRISYFTGIVGKDISTSGLVFGNTSAISILNHKIVQVPYIFDQLNIIDYERKSTTGIVERNCYNYKAIEDIISQYSDFDEFIKHVTYYNINISTSDNYIALLQDGVCPISECETHAPHPTKIKFFSWEGAYKKTYLVKERLRHIAFDDRTGILIGVDMDNNIYKYDFHEILD